MTTSGVLTEFPIPTPGSLPVGIVMGPDGNLWFMEQTGNKVARMTPDGVVTDEFQIPTPVSNAAEITTGPDGNLWFSEQSAGKIGRITTAGVITEFALSDQQSIPHGIVTGPDGNLWFVGTQGFGVGRISRYGDISNVVPITAQGTAIAAGPDGNLWFGDLSGVMTRLTTSGVVTSFPLPSATSIDAIVAGPDGSLWFTEESVGKIGRITTGPCTANATTLCLLGGRFSARATWAIPNKGVNGQAGAVPLSNTSGWFWFFDPGNIELAVKVLSGCHVNGHEWVFAAGLTDVEVTLTVDDLEAGGVKTYASTAGAPFAPILDTKAFAACPP